MAVYTGIGTEKGKRIDEEAAFTYAMERVTTDQRDAEEFCNYFTGVRYGKSTPEELMQFRSDLVEWFYSGNWVKEE